MSDKLNTLEALRLASLKAKGYTAEQIAALSSAMEDIIKDINDSLKTCEDHVQSAHAPANAEAKPTMAFRYKFYVSTNGEDWKEVPTTGEFSNIMHNPVPQTVSFGNKVSARYIKLDATTPDATPAKVALNEIGIRLQK